jgi:hypothetical protein
LQDVISLLYNDKESKSSRPFIASFIPHEVTPSALARALR